MNTYVTEGTGKGQCNSRYVFLILIFASILALASYSTSYASTVAIQWDPDTDPGVSGYKVYYQQDSSAQPFSGTGATQGASPVNVQTQTSITISGLDPAHAYYFAVTAYNASGAESAYSNIVYVPELVSPTVTVFTLPATASSTTVAVSSFAATDNTGVTGYLITESATAPDASAAGWTASAPSSFTFASAGSKSAYAWAKDAAGNVSSSRSASVTISLSYPLSLTFAGTGDGFVNGGMTCSKGKSCPSDSFASGSTATLMPTPSSNSIFVGWSGACTNTSGNCILTMNGAKNVTATFNINPVAWIPPSTAPSSYFGLLSDSYNAAAAGTTIKAMAHTFIENLSLNRGIGITITGGYNEGYSSNAGTYTTLDGTLTIQSGSLIVAGLIIQ